MRPKFLKLSVHIHFTMKDPQDPPSHLQPEPFLPLNTHTVLSADAQGGLHVSEHDGKPIQALNDI